MSTIQAYPDTVYVTHGQPITSSVPLPYTDDGDGSISYSEANGPSDGTLSFNSDGSYQYLYNYDFADTDSFTYTATDSNDDSDTATITIVVTNQPPTAQNACFDIDPGQIFTGSVSADDPDGDPLTYSAATLPANGTLVLNGDGTFTYTPNPDFVDDQDTFTFIATDGLAQSDAAPVKMNVRAPSVSLSAVNQTPTLMDVTSFSITVPPAVVSGTYEVQMMGTGNPAWVVVGSTQTSAVTERVAGNFQARGALTLKGKTYYSQPINITVQFPTAAQIMGDPSVAAAMDQAWANTLAFATANAGQPDANGNYVNNERKEFGFWIELSTTGAGGYQFAQFSGIILGNTDKGGISPGDQPPDDPANPVLGVGGTYTVAVFHTHTPMFYRYNVNPRPTGPSDTDLNTLTNLPGIVYDYINGNSIGPGYGLNEPADAISYGVNYRSTPP